MIAHADINEPDTEEPTPEEPDTDETALKEGLYLNSDFSWNMQGHHPPVLHNGELKITNMAGESNVQCKFEMYSAYPPAISEEGQAHLKKVLEACFGAATQDAAIVQGTHRLERIIQYEDGSHHWERDLSAGQSAHGEWCERGQAHYTGLRPPGEPCLDGLPPAPSTPDWFDWESVAYDGAEVVWIEIIMNTEVKVPFAVTTCGHLLERTGDCGGLYRAPLGSLTSVWLASRDPLECAYEASRNACASSQTPPEFFEWPPFFTTEGSDYVARVLRPLTEAINGHPTAGWWMNTHYSPNRMIHETVVRRGETRDNTIVIDGVAVPSRGPMKVLTDGVIMRWGGEVSHARETGCGEAESCGWGDPYGIRPGFSVSAAVPFDAIPKFRTCVYDNPAYEPGHQFYRWDISGGFSTDGTWGGRHCGED